MNKVIKLVLPMPPSTNRYWRTRIAHKGVKPYVQTYASEDAKRFKAQAQLAAAKARCKPFIGPVAVQVAIYRPAKRGDLDNCLKVLLDSLNGIAYQDDQQIVEIHAARFDDKDNPRAEVLIKAAEVQP